MNVLEQKKNSKCDTSDDFKKGSLECFGRKGTLQCRVPAGFGLLAALVRSPFQQSSWLHLFYKIKNVGEK